MTGWVWYEMARRKVQFHSDKQWYDVNLWIPLAPSAAKRANKNNLLLVCHGREVAGVVNWYRPTGLAWDTKIKPLIEKYDLDTLTRLAGWEV